jgi:dihydrofolate synthase/folylpolyglutamate synthase
MRELSERIGGPWQAPIIHVAGTKGKGSTVAVAASILRAAGLSAGTFTSPHLHTFRERISLNGEPASEEQFAGALARVWPHIEAMGNESPNGRPTTFEALTAMAFDLFRHERVDAQVIEVGLGGRLDSTNVVDAAVDIITSISLDHTAILGDTIAEVAAEKAGIIRSAVPVVTSPQPADAFEAIAQRAREQDARLLLVGRDIMLRAGSHSLSEQRFGLRTTRDEYALASPLLGAHQRDNVAVAVAAVEQLGLDLSPKAVVEGVRDVRWDGRFQALTVGDAERRNGPPVVVDGAHNPYSIMRLVETVREYVAPERTVVVFGCSDDKDFASMIDGLAELATSAVVCASHHPRAAAPDAIARAFEAAGVPTEHAPDIPGALAAAQAACGPADLVLVTGSLFVVAEVLQAWYGIQAERYPELEAPNLMTGIGLSGSPP